MKRFIWPWLIVWSAWIEPTSTGSKMDPLGQLRDIRGLDAIGIWPLAPGWWVLLVAGPVLVGVLIWVLHRLWRRYRPSPWARAARRNLAELQQRLEQAEVVQNREILELVRRIALARFPRSEVANLHGEAWLLWLQRNDPKEFDWLEYRDEMVEQSYRPGEPEPWARERVQAVLSALRHWTRGSGV
ncbi:MAG: DUF4381 domain-containing protein [Gammaproteobacteria bacterium]|nr:DUF4381 domain-containing protein [Gammaproteobacteria bacterium]